MLLIDEKSQNRQTSLEHWITPQTPSHVCQFCFPPNGRSETEVELDRWQAASASHRRHVSLLASCLFLPHAWCPDDCTNLSSKACFILFSTKKDQPAFTCRFWEQLHKGNNFLVKKIEMFFFQSPSACVATSVRGQMWWFLSISYCCLLRFAASEFVLLHCMLLLLQTGLCSPPPYTRSKSLSMYEPSLSTTRPSLLFIGEPSKWNSKRLFEMKKRQTGARGKSSSRSSSRSSGATVVYNAEQQRRSCKRTGDNWNVTGCEKDQERLSGQHWHNGDSTATERTDFPNIIFYSFFVSSLSLSAVFQKYTSSVESGL